MNIRKKIILCFMFLSFFVSAGGVEEAKKLFNKYKDFPKGEMIPYVLEKQSTPQEKKYVLKCYEVWAGQKTHDVLVHQKMRVGEYTKNFDKAKFDKAKSECGKINLIQLIVFKFIDSSDETAESIFGK